MCRKAMHNATYLCIPCRNAWAMGRREADDEDLPVQPAQGAVVLDRNGMAWQREGDTWNNCWRASPTGQGYSSSGTAWFSLVRNLGPLRELH